MRKLVVSEWMTLDGVFDADTMGQWFRPYDSDDRQAWITEAVLASDAFVFGRITYELLAAYWPTVTDRDSREIEIADRLNDAPKYVVSSTLETGTWSNSTIIKKNVVDELAKLKQQPGHNILVFGSATLVRSLMAEDVIDEYRFLVHPIVMGSGKRPFKDGMATMKLKLIETKMSSLGVTFLSYHSAKS
jgi:dihydrofolate reductase